MMVSQKGFVFAALAILLWHVPVRGQDRGSEAFLVYREADEIVQKEAPASMFNSGSLRELNLNLPAHIEAKDGEVTVFADFENASESELKLYVINNSDKEVSFESQDNDIYFKLEYEDENGVWIRAQNHRSSWCGNSYYPISLPAGMHFVIDGYRPSHGGASRVRYKMYGSRNLVSGVGPGFVLKSDIDAAAFDGMGSRAIPEVLRANLLNQPHGYGGVRNNQDTLFAVELLSIYSENRLVRRELSRLIEKVLLPAGEDDFISQLESVMEKSWPQKRDFEALLLRCRDVVDSSDSEYSASRKAVAWRVLRELLFSDETDFGSLVKGEFIAAIYGTCIVTLSNADAEDVSSAAASFLSNKKYANQFISDQLLLDWLYRDSRSLMREAARLLVTRGNEEGVAEAALQNDPETRMRFFEVLVKGGGGYNSVVYSPRGEVVRQVWERCARENPTETVRILTYADTNSSGPNRFHRCLREPLIRFLKEEAKRVDWSADETGGVDSVSVSRVIEFLDRWGKDADAVVFRSLLNHPAYQSYTTKDKEIGKQIEVRNYRVRSTALKVLKKRGIIAENVIVEQKYIVDTGEPLQWKSSKPIEDDGDPFG